MSSPVKLVTPYPTMDEVAELYGISPTRLKRLKSMVSSLVSQGRRKPVAGRSAAVRSRASKNSHHAHATERAAKRK
jgi:hypothetical protein